ncbi:MAG: nuclear transport factor 2 family protein [Pseudomonadota bacterium]
MTNNNESSLLAAEEARRQAMVANDIPKLELLLADGLVYVHSTGGVDSKQGYIDKLKAGSLQYKTVEFNDVSAKVIGTVGLLRAAMRAVITGKDGMQRNVINTYLGVWEHGPSGWQLLMVQGSAVPAPAP